MTYGTALAILTDGRHVVVHGAFPTWETFKNHARDCLKADRYNVDRFLYAYGHESQWYTAPEFLEVFCAQ